MSLREAIDEFNRLHGIGVVDDPYARWRAALEERGPVVAQDPFTLGGGPDAPVPIPRGMLDSCWSALSYDAASAIMRDQAHVSVSSRASSDVIGRTILNMDEPEHRVYRNLLQKGFTPAAVERWDDEVIRPVVHSQIDRVFERGGADMVSEVLLSYPIRVIAAVIGVPDEDVPRFHDLAFQLTQSARAEAARAASVALHEYFGSIIEQRRSTPGNDLITMLLAADVDGQRLTDEELISYLRLLLPAGAQTTYHASSSLLTLLLTHPDQLEAVRRDRSLIAAAVDETIRFEPPLTVAMRPVVADVDICGTTVPAGTILVAVTAAGNRDRGYWDDPDAFDIARPARPHLSFAHGPHTCLGMHLAKTEMRSFLEVVLDRMPGLRLDPDHEPPRISGLTHRAAAELHVRWD